MSNTPRSDQNSLEWNRAHEAGCSLVFAQGLEREVEGLRERVAELIDVLETSDGIYHSGWWLDKKEAAIAKTKEAK